MKEVNKIKKKALSLKLVFEDPILKKEHDRLLYMWAEMDDGQVQLYFDHNLKLEYKAALKNRVSFGFTLWVFMLHQSFRVSL